MDDTPHNISDDIRYQPKAVDDDDWIAGFLDEQPAGVLGLVDGTEPYVVTQLFVYDADADAIYLHGASGGRTRDIVEAGGAETTAAFTVSEMGRFIPHEIPMEFTVEYESVTVFGTLSMVPEDEEKRHALEAFMADLAPHLEEGRDYERITKRTMDVTSVYRLDIDTWSGKRGLKDPDHDGAYDLDAVRENAKSSE